MMIFSAIFTPGELEIPQGDAKPDTIKMALSVFFGIAGVVAVLIVVIAGFQYVLSQGDPGKTAKARNAIIYALIGLAISVFAFTIVGFVIAETTG